MSGASPPKPYELSGGASRPSLDPSPGASSVATLSDGSTTSVTTAGALVPRNQNYGLGSTLSQYGGASTYGSGYGSSYGSSMYGSRYGGYGGLGSGYGSSGYGSSYGSSYGGYGGYGSYGGHGGYGNYGGYGNSMMGGYGPYGYSRMGPDGMPLDGFKSVVNGGYSFIHGVESQVQMFGRISELLHMNFEALHMSFSSLLRLVTNVSLLKTEMWGILRSFTTLRFLHIIYLKLRRFFARLRGLPEDKLYLDYKEAWEESQQHASWTWVPFIFSLSLGWWLLHSLYRFFRPQVHTPEPPLDPDPQAANFLQNLNPQQQQQVLQHLQTLNPQQQQQFLHQLQQQQQQQLPPPPQQPFSPFGMPQPPFGGYGNGFGNSGFYGSPDSNMMGGLASSMPPFQGPFSGNAGFPINFNASGINTNGNVNSNPNSTASTAASSSSASASK